MIFEYVNEAYGVNACTGRRVTMNGRLGTIVKEMGPYIGVNFDDDKPGVASPCHPTWEMVYSVDVIEPRKMTRSQQNYRDYLDSAHFEGGDSFADYMGWSR